jgi:hypothetical protein
MSEYDNNNRGAIWKNDKKETDNHPDFTGSLNIEGVEFWVSAWKRKPDAGEKAPALSFTVRLKETNTNTSPKKQNAPQASKSDDYDDDIPY